MKATSKSSAKEKDKESSIMKAKRGMHPAGAQKLFSKRSDEAGKFTVTLYYREIPLLLQEKVDDMTSQKCSENPWNHERSRRQVSQEFKDYGHGFELTSEYKDGIFYIRHTIDYTKTIFNKLKEIVPGLTLDDKTAQLFNERQSYQGRNGRKINKWESSSALLLLFSYEFMGIF